MTSASAAQALDRLERVLARQEVLALQLLAAARCELHAEVRQPVEPRPRHPALLGDRLGRPALEHVHRRGGGEGAEELARRLCGGVADPALEPHLVDADVGPPGEEADAVGAARDRVDVLGQRLPAEPREDVLAHVVGRLDVEGHGGDDAEGAERHDAALEVGVAARHPADLAIGADDLECRDRRCERAVLDSRPVSARRDRARDGDVRERREVAEGPALRLQPGRHVAVCRPAGDPGRAGLRVDLHRRRQVGERDEHATGPLASVVSVRSVKLCRDPSARTRGAAATTCCTCSIDCTRSMRAR